MHIISANYVISSPDYAKCPKPDRPEYAFIGRSNVGKSSLINMLCHSENLAKISSNPGKTKLINHFEIEHADQRNSGNKRGITRWYFVDLPGYGFARVSRTDRQQWDKMVDDYLKKRENLQYVFILIDSRHSPQEADIEFVNKLGKWQIPFGIVFTKADKENQRTVSAHIQSFLGRLKENWEFLPRHFVTSALKKTGKDKLLAFIKEMNENSPE
jgi:GTP-binding protein